MLASFYGARAHRDRKMLSSFDFGSVLGKGVREELRLIDGRISFLDGHLDYHIEPFGCREANGAHTRPMVTRGGKSG